jgi:hypothetical protein
LVLGDLDRLFVAAVDPGEVEESSDDPALGGANAASRESWRSEFTSRTDRVSGCG